MYVSNIEWLKERETELRFQTKVQKLVSTDETPAKLHSLIKILINKCDFSKDQNNKEIKMVWRRMEKNSFSKKGTPY